MNPNPNRKQTMTRLRDLTEAIRLATALGGELILPIQALNRIMAQAQYPADWKWQDVRALTGTEVVYDACIQHVRFAPLPSDPSAPSAPSAPSDKSDKSDKSDRSSLPAAGQNHGVMAGGRQFAGRAEAAMGFPPIQPQIPGHIRLIHPRREIP